MTDTEYFSEHQSLAPRIMGLAALSTALVGLYAFIETKDVPDAEIGLLIIAGALIFMFIMYRFMGLRTIVTDDGVRVKGLLFINRVIAFDLIASSEKREYKPLGEYGGWGYRIGPSGKAYNAQGNEGVQLVLKDGGRILIGSQRADELAEVIGARLTI